MNILVTVLEEKIASGKRIAQADKEVIDALKSNGHAVNVVPWHKLLKTDGYDAVFNLCDGIEGDTRLVEISIAEYLHSKGIPVTGNTADTFRICSDKLTLKQALERAKLPVPGLSRDKFPLIVKPIGADAAVGMQKSSIVNSKEEIEKEMARIKSGHGMFSFSEIFVPGKEFVVPVLNGKALRPVEVVFKNPDKLNMLTYKAKWDKTSNDYQLTSTTVRKELVKLERLAEQTCNAVGIRGYATVDMRVNKSDVFIIDVNPNCFIGRDSDLVKSAEAMGMSYEKLVEEILNGAIH